jgi:Ca2+/Na+ antiporter
MGILIPLLMIFFCCLFIWRACDGFEVASEYIGRNMSEGVRGGTINAISSSLPELFTTLIALFVLKDQHGFSVGIGTTAGSALFNGMIIPAACILSVIGTVVLGVKVTSVNVSTKVLLRDGLSLIICEIVLILAINGTKLHWWQGLILMGMYVAYFLYMILSMKASQEDDNDEEEDEDEDEEKGPIATIFYWLSLGPLLDLESLIVKDRHKDQMKNETWNGWPLLFSSTLVIGVACWILVKACEWLGTGPSSETDYMLFGNTYVGFDMPTMFVAVIFASMATSVPDTVISIRDAKDGDYDDAVANALGSNIFDICFALGFPLFLFTLINGPLEVTKDVAAQSAQLRFVLLILTVIGFFTYYIGKRGTTSGGVQYVEMKRGKAAILLTIYLFFVVYIIALGQHEAEWAEWARSISSLIDRLLSKLPSIGG